MKYPMVFAESKEGDILVKSLDIPEAFTQGNGMHDAREMAADALALCLEEYTKEGREIPQPTSLDDPDVIKAKVKTIMDKWGHGLHEQHNYVVIEVEPQKAK